MEAEVTLFEGDTEEAATCITQDNAFLDSVFHIVRALEGFTVCKYESEESSCLLIQHQFLHLHPPLGLISRCRILIKSCEHIVHIVLKEIETGILQNPSDVLLLCEKYSPKSNLYKFCMLPFWI